MSARLPLPRLFATHPIRRFLNINFFFIGLIILWASIGIAMLYSAAGQSFTPWAERQLIYLAAGLIIMIILALTRPEFWLYYAYYFYGFALLLLLAVEFMGTAGMGAKRWLDLGLFNMQPSELMKPALVLALARYYQKLPLRQVERIYSLFIPIILIMLPVALVIRQPDLGTGLLLLIGGVMVLFLTGVRLWKFITIGVMGLISMPFSWFYLLHDYQKQRILTFLNPESDPLGAGYHILQSKIALGAGGLTGRGFGAGTQSQNKFLPEKHTDFIFTMLGEEFGLRGTYGLLILFMVILLVGSYLSFRAIDPFNRLIGFGMINNFMLYVIINIAMVTGLAPVVGLPLPLISYGGSATISVMASFGLILMVGLHRDQQIKTE